MVRILPGHGFARRLGSAEKQKPEAPGSWLSTADCCGHTGMLLAEEVGIGMLLTTTDASPEFPW